ncbi:alpha/beta hydrolase family protein [Umezawaea tangerina]|uniref:Dienelactone hydrolase n=1 Tax=Umezawaea tangerina TaxID=84725 RepID=A0A2T0T9B6_9PSEU|nr:alpha/beta hydrolase [Umezawaea tangerina]PRY42228.1 dienelactone hydrolase [Umezawaea tangerina]
MAQRAPHEFEFVVETPFTGTTGQVDGYDTYLPPGADGPLPAVVIVTGPSPEVYPIRPRRWPVYQGYARLLAERGVVAVVADPPYHSPEAWPDAAEDLARIVDAVRAADGVDADRVALWAFSGGALLTGRWLAESPEWLRCLALSYPMMNPADAVAPGRPIVLTRVGLESAELQETVDAFLATDVDVHVVHVPDGQHAFDVLDHTQQSRDAVLEAADLVLGHLTA